MSLDDEQRKFPRIRLKTPISVAGEEGQSLDLADILDLTVEGISFLSPTPQKPGDGIYVLFPTIKDVRETEIPSEVIRCAPVPGAVAAKKYKICARFIEMQDSFLMDILALVHGKHDNP
jgi:hypothetical protein